MTKQIKRALCTILISIALIQPTAAEVLHKSANGFAIEIIREVDVSADKAYQQFIQVGEWWLKEHSWFGSSKNFSIDPRAGGCFCEIDGDREVLHMTVTHVEPGKEMHMVGGLGPLQLMGLSGGMLWRFESVSESKTRIIHSYNVSGYTDNGTDNLAAIVDQVQSSQVDALVNLLTSL